MSAILSYTDILFYALVGGIMVILLYVAIISKLEKEERAARRAFGIAILLPAALLFISEVVGPETEWIRPGILALFGTGVVLILFPTKCLEKKLIVDRPQGQINEKNVMFSRRLYVPGTKRYEDYYAAFPEHEAPDNEFRAKPGLLSEGSSLYEPYTFTASKAIFDAIHAFYPIVDGTPNEKGQDHNDRQMSDFLMQWIKKEGAVSAGITETKDYHWYSQVGRGPDFGKEARLPHPYAIAFTVEMDKEMMDTAPQGPTVMESARQYMRAAVIATDVAKYIRDCGYHARAHIDGNYRLVCPLVARDAGLGEIGRMGLLMTPELGPRVRIGVITTDMPLKASEVKDLSHMIKFCRICKKCADVCPSNAISFDDRTDINGVKRWQISQEKCFSLWCTVGTDCGKCMSDCPFSHPDNFFHNTIRVLLKNSMIFRYLALKMDDFFYGRKPKPAKIPLWIKNNE